MIGNPDDELFPLEGLPEIEDDSRVETLEETYERGKRDGIALAWRVMDNPGLRE